MLNTGILAVSVAATAVGIFGVNIPFWWNDVPDAFNWVRENISCVLAGVACGVGSARVGYSERCVTMPLVNGDDVENGACCLAALPLVIIC